MIRIPVSKARARRLWLHAQRLDEHEPFGKTADAVQRAVEHLGYVQIDTIHVIERSHHHILYTRIPRYRREDLQHAQRVKKTVFEYWTHALSYVPTRDFRYFVKDMREFKRNPGAWYHDVTSRDIRRVLRTVQDEGVLSIRDFDDETLVEKTHPWASRKPSKKALQHAFYSGNLVISEREGMLKKYELTSRHFGWSELPKPATEREILDYLLERALRAQALVSLDSICFLDAPRKPAMHRLIESLVKQGSLAEIALEGVKAPHWARPGTLEESPPKTDPQQAHLLSPFDPLVIQRKRLASFFDYEHCFEAYLPKEKRRFGYFALPVLVGDEFKAVIDLKTDRAAGRMLIQKWSWLKRSQSADFKRLIEEELGRFENFQLNRS